MIKNKKTTISIFVLIVTHLVGLVGFLTEYQSLFMQATFFHLFISAAILLYNHKDWNRNFLIFAVIAFSIGFLIEVLGVATGIIFGNYQYGPTLGIKIFNVPLIIGVNWLMLVYLVGIMLNKLDNNIWLKSIIGGGLLVFLDVFIEPVAMQLDFWGWENQEVPLLNYLAWFIVGSFLVFIFNALKFKKSNPVAAPLFIIYLTFFITINVLVVM
jgi:bisanhydrobacterioruberin hydratase